MGSPTVYDSSESIFLDPHLFLAFPPQIIHYLTALKVWKDLYIRGFFTWTLLTRVWYNNASLFVFSSVDRIEQNSQQPNSRLQINPKEEGTVVELTQFETGDDKMVAIAS